MQDTGGVVDLKKQRQRKAGQIGAALGGEKGARLSLVHPLFHAKIDWH